MITLLGITGGILISNAALKEYHDHAEPAFAIPDISSGFIPQGIDHDPGSGCFFLTGYMGGRSHSPVYAINGSDGTLRKKVLLTTGEGEPFRGHAGGLSVFDDRLYIAGSTDACMYSVSIGELLNTEDNGPLGISGKTELKTESDRIRVSFTSRDRFLLYAGEFHNEPVFSTHDSHKAEQKGIKQKAYLFGFSPDNSHAEPERVYSIPDNVQGACFDGEYLYLSQSHGLLPGRILSFDLSKREPSGTRNVLGKEVPLFFLSEKTADKVTAVPSMPEEITVADGYLYILHEAASNRYLIGKLLQLDKVYKAPIGFFR